MYWMCNGTMSPVKAGDLYDTECRRYPRKKRKLMKVSDMDTLLSKLKGEKEASGEKKHSARRATDTQ